MKPILNYHTSYSLSSSSGGSLEGGEAVTVLDERTLTLLQDSKQVFSIPYFQVVGIRDEDYAVDLALASGETLHLHELGYEYENFLLNLYKNRNELLLRYTLMQEERVAFGIEAHYEYSDGVNPIIGDCEVRVYESALVILPYKADPIRIPLCFLNSHDYLDYLFKAESKLGQKLWLSMMGEKTDYFVRSLEEALSAMLQRSRSLITELAPEADLSSIERVAQLMKDGVAVPSTRIKEVSQKLWQTLEEKIRETDLGEEYSYLTSQSSFKEVWIGAKRGLMGDRTGYYLWFMTPIIHGDPNKPGNTLVLEAASSEEVGRATYLFRIMGNREYAEAKSFEEIEDEAIKFIEDANYCMIEINFRREPIYLSSDRLREPENEMYLYAAQKMKPLKKLREHYVGRVPHTGLESWKKNVEALLSFNIKSVND